MKAALVTFVILCVGRFAGASTGENRVDRLETIKAVEGDDVRLQCRLDLSLDLSAYTSDWIRVDLNTEVHAYRRKQDLLHLQMDQYRNRTTLNREDLSRGVLTLQISSVKLLDSGQYRCYVPKLNVGCVFNLTVVEKEQQNKTKRADSTTTGPPEEEVTEPDDPGAAKNETVIVIASVCCLAPAVAVVAVVFILVKRGKIKICKKMLRPVRGKEAETMPNNYEMENLRNQAAERDGDPHGAAENGALHSVQHDTVYH